jgi:hypothetical protein
VYKALGWSIRYFMALKDNYFGSFTHFSTLGEFLAKKDEGLPFGDPIVLKYRPGKVTFTHPLFGWFPLVDTGIE